MSARTSLLELCFSGPSSTCCDEEDIYVCFLFFFFFSAEEWSKKSLVSARDIRSERRPFKYGRNANYWSTGFLFSSETVSYSVHTTDLGFPWTNNQNLPQMLPFRWCTFNQQELTTLVDVFILSSTEIAFVIVIFFKLLILFWALIKLWI